MRLIQIRALWILFILISVVISASAADKTNKHFLWKIEKNGHTAYLLGSIHAGKHNMYPLDSIIDKTYEMSDFLAVEADITNTAKVNEIQQLAMQKGMYHNSKTLKDSISAELYSNLETEFEKLGLPISQVNMLKPWMIQLTLANLAIKKAGLNMGSGIDLHFLTKAKGKKQIVELESMDFQINMLSGFSEETQIMMLEDSINDLEKFEELLNKLFKAWTEGNVTIMEKELLGKTDKPEYSEFNKAMWIDRNYHMAEKIEGFLKSDKTGFVVVGSGHIIGEKGIASILKTRGYIITQM